MRLFRRGRLEREPDELRIFNCGDIHGSDVCFRKFLNAGPHYQADVLVLGGDITGKALVPIVDRGDGTWYARLHGELRECRSREEAETLRAAISSLGFYPVDATPERLAELEEDSEAVREAFRERTLAQLRSWIELADERLAGSGLTCLVMPGNDDDYYVDPVLSGGERVENVDGRVVTLANGVEVASLSSSNETPWHSAREFDEEELRGQLESLVGSLRSPCSAVLNVHVPPRASGLDTVQKLDAELRPIFENGAPVEIPCGSTAVREAIERTQPLLGLHGHVHESRGAALIGRTLCLNPGSDYASGRLHGVLVDVTPREVKRHTFTEG
jgi:Icc-related predicted phosphoesterase